MAVTKDHTKMSMAAYEAKWKTVTLGWAKDVDPSGLKLKKVEKKVNEIGDIAIDHVIIGLDGTVKTVLHQVNIDVLKAVMPWAGSTGSIPLNPTALYASCYALADVLRLHPRGNADATEDIVLLKAFPDVKMIKRDGTKFADVEIEWLPYPDQTSLTASPPTLVYGYIGDPPTP